MRYLTKSFQNYQILPRLRCRKIFWKQTYIWNYCKPSWQRSHLGVQTWPCTPVILQCQHPRGYQEPKSINCASSLFLRWAFVYRILQRKEVGVSLTTSFVAIITLATVQYQENLRFLIPLCPGKLSATYWRLPKLTRILPWSYGEEMHEFLKHHMSSWQPFTGSESWYEYDLVMVAQPENIYIKFGVETSI